MATEQHTANDGVRAASDRFYDALDHVLNGDPSRISEVWSHADDVTTMHPIGGREVGWADVEPPWASVAERSADGKVTREDQYVNVVGDVGYELATESVSFTFAGQPIEAEYRTTNVYRLEDGEWKIVHHHADSSPELIAILEGATAE